MPTAKDAILAHLTANGPSTVSEIANATGYSPGHIRNTCRQMVNDGTISGTKVPKRVPAVIINGQFHVVTGSRKQLLRIVKIHAPHLLATARGLSVSQLQSLIADKIADRTVSYPQRIWKFSR